MQRSAETLRRIAAQTPTLAERHSRALRALEPLRRELESSGTAIDQILRAGERLGSDVLAKRLAPLAVRQKALATELAALDLPGLGARPARIRAALTAAVSDMTDGALFDLAASQAWVRREFDRLRAVLEGNPGADVRVDELHQKLAKLLITLNARADDLTRADIEALAPHIQEAALHLAAVTAPEAPALLNDARTAMQAAELAARDAPPDEARRRIRSLADALGALSDRLNGFESDLARLNRLASNRRRAAEKPKELFASDEAIRQLGREADELVATRVGVSAQALKKRATELYARLRAKSDPDRLGSDQKALATALDELAAKTADNAELAIGFDRPARAEATLAERFLPSALHLDALREIGRQNRSLHLKVTNFTTDLARRLRPAETNPLAAIDAKQRGLMLDDLALARAARLAEAAKAADAVLRAADRIRVGQIRGARDAGQRAAAAFHQISGGGGNKEWSKQAADLATRQEAINAELATLQNRPDAITAQQIARAEELARDADALSLALERTAQGLSPEDATCTLLRTSANSSLIAGMQLRDAAKKAAAGAHADAEKFRTAASSALGTVATAISHAAPIANPSEALIATGDAIRTAGNAMGNARAALAPGGAPSGATAAMRAAHQALVEAAKTLAE
jgi:hypothetical protein